MSDQASRRAARERVVALSYEAEVKGETVGAVIAALPVVPDDYVVEMAGLLDTHAAEIDTCIADHLTGWTLHRLAALDRAVLRVGVVELVHRPDVPTGVALAEAVELATRFSTEESGRFVNGVLGAVARSVRPEA